MIVYPRDRLYEEMAYLAFYLHWPYSEIAQLDHLERQRWVREVGAIYSRLKGLPKAGV